MLGDGASPLVVPSLHGKRVSATTLPKSSPWKKSVR